jgi:riboflavin synthase
MFTGIIEDLGVVVAITKTGTNLDFKIESKISKDLKIDQSLAHNGVCLTVVHQDEHTHTVTAIKETLERSNLGKLQIGALVNLERAMSANARLDGHLVQGHVDTVTHCLAVKEENGSWLYTFANQKQSDALLVDKGSVCINGVSLTVVNPDEKKFSVAIIPYTYEHTTFKNIIADSTVNLEFDIIGKYIAKQAALYIK